MVITLDRLSGGHRGRWRERGRKCRELLVFPWMYTCYVLLNVCMNAQSAVFGVAAQVTMTSSPLMAQEAPLPMPMPLARILVEMLTLMRQNVDQKHRG